MRIVASTTLVLLTTLSQSCLSKRENNSSVESRYKRSVLGRAQNPDQTLVGRDTVTYYHAEMNPETEGYCFYVSRNKISGTSLFEKIVEGVDLAKETKKFESFKIAFESNSWFPEPKFDSFKLVQAKTLKYPIDQESGRIMR